jgi:hypothetical protein
MTDKAVEDQLKQFIDEFAAYIRSHAARGQSI